MRRVLITGAAGRIGTLLREGLHGQFDTLRLLDVAPLGDARSGEELVRADIRDLDSVTSASAGIDSVVHLAGIPYEDAFERILQTNIVGTYNVFEAARRQGCRRVVFASSLHVTGFYEGGEHIGPQVPLRPDGFYGLGKAFGENLGSMCADKHGLEVVCARIGTLADQPKTPRELSTWLSPRDAVQLFYCCLVAPDVGFTVVYGASANDRGWWDLDPARRLGYQPVDNAEQWAATIDTTNVDPDDSGKGPQGGAYAR